LKNYREISKQRNSKTARSETTVNRESR
jgi:hypothetical protein